MKSYSNDIPGVTWKEANFLFFCVKGFLIPVEYTDEDIRSMYDSYFKRLWGNNERMVYCQDEFDKIWDMKN
jgi:hypothetical protein